MSVPRLLVMSAVPYNLSRCQSNFSQKAVKNSVLNPQYSYEDSNNLHNMKELNVNRNSETDVSNHRIIKKRNRMLKNRMASQVSREKAKWRKELLEKQLVELQVEQMKIRLINHNLEMRQAKLQEENSSLRERLSVLTNPPKIHKEECVVDSIGQAEEVGSVAYLLHPHSGIGGISQQFSNTEFSESFVLPNSPYSDEGYKTDEPCNSPSIADAEIENVSPDWMELDLSDCLESSDNFDELEKYIFGDSNSSIRKSQCNEIGEKESVTSNTSSQLREMKEIKIQPCENLSNFLPPWTFENLFEDNFDSIF